MKTKFITLAMAVMLSLTSCNVKNGSCLYSSSSKIECFDDQSIITYTVKNICDWRVDYYQVIVTITDKQSGHENYYGNEFNDGILANEKLEKAMIIDRFDCDKVNIKLLVTPFK